MILASAQTKPEQGDITGNLEEHCRMVNIASDNGAGLIVFPEMSVTGYDRENAERLAFTVKDSRLDPLRILSTDDNIIIIAGVPVKMNADLFIGAFVLFPDSSLLLYTKQYLHTGEDIYFKPSFDYDPVIKLAEERMSLSVCADIEYPAHPLKAYEMKTTTYISAIFYSRKGMQGAHQLLAGYAKKYTMNILMSNYCGKVWGVDSGGRSAFWNNNGQLIAELNGNDPGLLIVEKNNDHWTGKTIVTEKL